MTEPTALTFELGYSRLQEISTRVTSEEVPVAEMCDLFAEGKGLQKALTDYLDEAKGRVEAIERGEGVQAFRIVSPEATPPTHGSDSGGQDEEVLLDDDFGQSASADTPAPQSSDDIPF